jgi:hypothetical protein
MKRSAAAATSAAALDQSADLVRTVAPPLAPYDLVIDRGHLARMTLGELSLEREVLQLFDRQATMLLARMKDAAPTVVAALAHTLNGSARGIGAWKVAEATETVERRAVTQGTAQLADAIKMLTVVVGDAQAMIADLLREGHA